MADGGQKIDQLELELELELELLSCKQRGLTIEAYFTKMSSLWDQLSRFESDQIPTTCDQCKHCDCNSRLQKRLFEEKKVRRFLRGLDDLVFADVRRTLLSMDPLPSVNEAYSILLREEDNQNFLLKLPKGIVAEILIRLPPKPLFALRSVSTRFKSAVMDPELAQKYTKRGGRMRIRGLLYPFMEVIKQRSNPNPSQPEPEPEPDPDPYSGCCREFFPVPTADKMHHKALLYYTRCPNDNRTRILASSNGLLLCQKKAFTGKTYQSLSHCHEIKLSVENPVTNQSVVLPCIYAPPPPGTSVLRDPAERYKWTCGFATRASELNGGYNVSYKVVYIGRPERWDQDTDFGTIVKIFSSDTGSWARPGVGITCPGPVWHNAFRGPDFCYKGVLHWIDGDTRTIVTYDPYNSPQQFGRIPLPYVGSSKILRSMSLVHFEQEDLVKCCEIECREGSSDLSLLVWRLLDYAKGWWSMEQRVRISPLCADKDLLRGCRQVIAPDPWNPEDGHCYVYARNNSPKIRSRVTVVDLELGREENVVFDLRGPLPTERLPLVPVVFSPWPSPFHYQWPIPPNGRVAKRKELSLIASHLLR